jgi:trans-aconitate 2-methyltransferase
VTSYTFGDSSIASERLRIVADVMAPVAQALLARAVPDPAAVRTAVDLGCGPGHTTRLLASCFPNASVVGVDQSEAYVAEAGTGAASNCRFVVGDVGAEPLPGAPADLVYARYLLSHLDDVAAYVARWCAALAPGGVLVLEEPESITSTDPDFAAYERISTTLVRASGGVCYAGPEMARMQLPTGVERSHDATVAVDVTAGQAAAMFWRNARAWSVESLARAGHDRDAVAALADRLRARENDPTRGLFDWRQRQTVVVKSL